MTGIEHDWVDLDRYLAIHDRCMERACSYFVDEPNIIAPNFTNPKVIGVHGTLVCKGGLVIHVDNLLRRDAGNRVRGTVYTYQAQFAEPPLRQIFRYDNAHVHRGTAHPDAFHKHVFDDRTWRETAVEHIGRERFPTLQQVIDELYTWWLQHRDDVLIYP